MSPMHFADAVPYQLISQRPGVEVTCSVMEPQGDGIADLNFILRGPAVGELGEWYDTYVPDREDELDWYALTFPTESNVNTIFFMHGPLFYDGGWWQSLGVQYLDENGRWQDVTEATLIPPYPSYDRRGERRSYDAYQIRFPEVSTRGLRLVGMVGGTAKATTMAYLAAGWLTEAEAERYLHRLQQPEPLLFRLISPERLWELIKRLRDTTGIAFDVQTRAGLGLDHFLEKKSYNQFHASQRQIFRPDSLYQLLGKQEGWDKFGEPIEEARRQVYETQEPQICLHHGKMAWLLIPFVYEDEVVGVIENRNLICQGEPDEAWHEQAIARLGIEPDTYRAALARVPRYSKNRLQDVTGLVRVILTLAEEQIQRSREMARLQSSKEAAEAASEAKGEFVALVSHELKTPMTAIKGYADLLLRAKSDNLRAEQKRFLERIRGNVAQMTTIISDLADIARAESGQLDVQQEAVALPVVIEKALLALHLQMEQQGQAFELDLADALPPAQADEERLLQIIRNLLSNAHKYTPAGGTITLRATVEQMETGPMLHIAVADSGIGIRREDQKRIFDKFFRTDNPEARSMAGGSGLGLHITRELVRLQGGQIWLESEAGEGSTFHFTVPVASAKRTAGAPGEAATGAG